MSESQNETASFEAAVISMSAEVRHVDKIPQQQFEIQIAQTSSYGWCQTDLRWISWQMWRWTDTDRQREK